MIITKTSGPQVFTWTVLTSFLKFQPPTDRTGDIPDSLYWDDEAALPDLVPANLLSYNSDPAFPQKKNSAAARPDIHKRTLKKVDEVIPMANSNPGPIDPNIKNGEHPPRQRPAKPVPIRDLVHPVLNEPLKNQQQVTFRLIKAGKPSNSKFFRIGNYKISGKVRSR